MNRVKKRFDHEIYNETRERSDCCEGYSRVRVTPILCSPICNPHCENADCIAPDTCVCHTGHIVTNNSNNTCYNVCDSCVNGECHGNDTECTCLDHYRRDPIYPHICDPICSPSCVNATCTGPNKCECVDGFEKHQDKTLDHICIPKCTKECIYGRCTAPEVCTCFEGYMNDEEAPSICLPVCNQTCENGNCIAPNSCKCLARYEPHPMYSFRCVPEAPENSFKKVCEFKMPKAVKYDKNAECFIIKDKVKISGDSQCSFLQPLSEPSCSKTAVCAFSECALRFRCSSKKLNRTNEIHCYLERNNFETDESPDSIIPITEWTDVILMIHPLQDTNSSVEVRENQSTEWTLHPLSRKPVCGKMHFAVEISSCNDQLVSYTVKSSHMAWINAILIFGFLLLVVAGVGGFLWARHRKLNNPLNYREDMMRGYNNECYEHGSAELVSDDESGQETDAPL